MTAHINSETRSNDLAPIAESAALIANFYGKRGQLQPLLDRLIQSLVLVPMSHHDYFNDATRTYLRHFEPAADSAHDTTIIQLALNQPGTVGSAWSTMRKQLEEALPDDLTLQAVWGYTLIYQAELVQEALLDTVLTELLSDVRQLHPDLSENPLVLAQDELPGGRIWLIDIPDWGDGLKASTVYMALSQPDSNNQLVRDVLYNPVAAMLMADLIAHKGYFQMRQYRLGDWIEKFRQKMDTLLKHSDGLLHELTQVTVPTSELDGLAREYGPLVSAVVHMNQLQISLLRQKFNFNWWCKQAGGGNVLEFHQHYLEEATQELDLLVTEGQRPLETARTVVEMTRVWLDKEQERKQQQIETILLAAAVVLSILILVDKDTARALLEFIGFPKTIGTLPLLGVQLIFVVITALLATLMIRLIRARHPKSSTPN
jgi:hypothetical protein